MILVSTFAAVLPAPVNAAVIGLSSLASALLTIFGAKATPASPPGLTLADISTAVTQAINQAISEMRSSDKKLQLSAWHNTIKSQIAIIDLDATKTPTSQDWKKIAPSGYPSTNQLCTAKKLPYDLDQVADYLTDQATIMLAPGSPLSPGFLGEGPSKTKGTCQGHLQAGQAPENMCLTPSDVFPWADEHWHPARYTGRQFCPVTEDTCKCQELEKDTKEAARSYITVSRAYTGIVDEMLILYHKVRKMIDRFEAAGVITKEESSVAKRDYGINCEVDSMTHQVM